MQNLYPSCAEESNNIVISNWGRPRFAVRPLRLDPRSAAFTSSTTSTTTLCLKKDTTQPPTITPDSTEKQAFVSCRLDYCNSLLAGVADVHLRRLQSVQNAAARLVSGTTPPQKSAVPLVCGVGRGRQTLNRYNFGCMAASDLLFEARGRFLGQAIQ